MPAAPVLLCIADVELRGRMLRDLAPLERRILECSDGNTALYLLEYERPQLVVTAETLPDMSGMELCRQIRALPFLTDCWVLLAYCALPDGLTPPAKDGPDDMMLAGYYPGDLAVRVTVGLRGLALREKTARLRQELALAQAEQERSQEDLNQTTRHLVEIAAQLQAEICRNSELEAERLQSVRSDTISQAAAALRHEINNPLFAISGSAESAFKRLLCLQERGVTDLEGLYNCISRIERGAERIHQVVRAISEMLTPVTTDYVPGVEMLDLAPKPHDKVIG